jgi:hypothetical protein
MFVHQTAGAGNRSGAYPLIMEAASSWFAPTARVYLVRAGLA